MSEFSHISGHRVLDLVNTVEWRLGGPEREEDLSDYAAVLRWCLESGYLTGPEAERLGSLAARSQAQARQECEGVIALRENAYRLLFDGEDGAAASLVAQYREALAGAELVRDAPGWTWRETRLTLATPRHRIARALMDFLGRDDLDRLDQCEDDICGWVYLDTSPRRNRRWCVTKDCGDRNRSRAYYARQKAKKSDPG